LEVRVIDTVLILFCLSLLNDFLNFFLNFFAVYLFWFRMLEFVVVVMMWSFVLVLRTMTIIFFLSLVRNVWFEAFVTWNTWLPWKVSKRIFLFFIVHVVSMLMGFASLVLSLVLSCVFSIKRSSEGVW
jgi:hypothetical protein